MSTQGYTTSFVVNQTPEEAFSAINNVRGWWSGEIEGPVQRKPAAGILIRHQLCGGIAD